MKYAVPEYIQIHNRCCCSTFWDPMDCGTPGFPVLHSLLEFAQTMGCEESDTTERLHFHFHALEKEMPTHSSVVAWRIPGTAEPGGLQSMGSHRVRHNWRDLAAAAGFLRFSWTFFRYSCSTLLAPSCGRIINLVCFLSILLPASQLLTLPFLLTQRQY